PRCLVSGKRVGYRTRGLSHRVVEAVVDIVEGDRAAIVQLDQARELSAAPRRRAGAARQAVDLAPLKAFWAAGEGHETGDRGPEGGLAGVTRARLGEPGQHHPKLGPAGLRG